MQHDRKKRGPERPEDLGRDQAGRPGGVHEPETTPAQERGERLDTGKTIARGGTEEGHVPGAEPAPDDGEPPGAARASPRAVMPPAPPGESPALEVLKMRAVSDAMTRLGERTDPAALAAEVRIHAGIDLPPEDVAAIQAELILASSGPSRRGG
jgi:hypothetical protein